MRRVRRSAPALLLLLALPAGGGEATKTAPRPRREATSFAESWTTKDGRRITHTVNRRFTFARAWRDRTTGVDLLLAETSDRRLDSGAEGEKSTVSVEAFRGSGSGGTLWSLHAEGSAGEARDDGLYRVTRPGCCGAQDLSTFFSLLDGKELFTSAAPIVSIDAPNSVFRRFAAYHDLMAAAPVPGGERDRRVVGRLQYGSDRARAESVLVVAPIAEPDESWAAKKVSVVIDGRESEGDRVDLWSADKAADAAKIGGFTIRVTAYTTPELLVEIPVEGDRLVPEKATLGKGVSLRK
jgi:hypothetical protein